MWDVALFVMFILQDIILALILSGLNRMGNELDVKIKGTDREF